MIAGLRFAFCVALALLVVSGCSDDTSTPTPDTTPPSQPTNLAASPYGSTQVDLAWTASTDNVGVTEYEVKRAGNVIGSSTTTRYSDAGLTPETEYCYTVAAKDGAGNFSDPCAQSCASTLATDTEDPTDPQNLEATAVGSDKVRLTWSPSTDNVGVAGYHVYRGTAQIGVATTTSYEDAGRNPGSTYCYKVRAFDADDNLSGFSPEDCATTLPAPSQHTATGTYTYQAGDHLLIIHVLASDFRCDGPQVGTETLTVVSLTSTELVIATGDGGTMTFTRAGGSSTDITGTWTASQWGVTYELTLRSNLTFTLIGTGYVSCEAGAWSQHWPDGYHVNLRFEDPQRDATSVTVAGPGIQTPVSLCYESGEWNNWTGSCEKVNFGSTHPEPPLTYTFTITEASGARTEFAVVQCFVEELPTNLSPDGFASGSVTFTWTRISQTGMGYRVELNDSQGQRIWESAQQTDISAVAYNGPPLQPGGTYTYYVSATSSGDCTSFGRASFTYSR